MEFIVFLNVILILLGASGCSTKSFICNRDVCEEDVHYCDTKEWICRRCDEYLEDCYDKEKLQKNCTSVCAEDLRIKTERQTTNQLRKQECSTPPVVLNAVHNGTNGSVPYGETVEYNCNSGYSLIGGGTLTCGGFGKWNGSVPFCNPIDAGGSGIPYNVFWPVVVLLVILLILAVNKEHIIKACKRIRRKPPNNRAPKPRDGEAGLGLLPQYHAAEEPVQQPGPQQPPLAPPAAQLAERITTDAASQTTEIPEPHQADAEQTTGRRGIGQPDPFAVGDKDQTKAMTVDDQYRSRNGSTSSMGRSMIQETTLHSARLLDKQHGWEQSESATANGHCGMQNGHAPSMEPDCHRHDTESHGRIIAVGN